jgi:hypothetical protein
MTAQTITGNEAFWGTIKLSADAIKLINSSPTLVTQLLDYQTSFTKQTAGAMSADTGTGTGTGWNGSAIYFAQNWTTLSATTIVGQLAHEIGHFENTVADIAYDAQYRPAASDQSVTANDLRAMMGLHREGEAVYNNWIVQQEIQKATSSDGTGKDGTKIYLAGDGLYSTGPSNLQSILDNQHASDVAGNLTGSQEKNAMIEDAMHVYGPLPTSEDGTTYYKYYAKINGGILSGQAPALGASSITFNDPGESGNITTMTDTFSSGQSVTQTFSGISLATSVTKDQFGNVLTQTTYSHNADGSYIANVYDAQGHATDQDQFHADGSEIAYHFNSNGTQNATVYNAQGNETEYATFGTNGVKTQDLFYDATSGRLTQENDFNADGSQTDHIFNANGTQNTAIFNAAGHETEYATFGTSGAKTQDLFYDATSGRLTQENDFNTDGSQVDHLFNANGTQTAYVFNAAGHETEQATFGVNGAKTQDLFYDATTGRETQENDFNTDGSQVNHLFNANGTQTTYVFNAAGHETEQATFGTNGKITQDLVYDGATGRELQETDYNTDGSGVAHIFNPNGTQNAAVFDPSGHVSEYATYGANGKITTDAFYDANGRETQLNEYSGNQTTVHMINADNSQTATVYNSSGHETEYAKFNTSGQKTDDYFFDGSTGRETEYDQYGNNGSMTAHLFNSNNTQNAIIFNGNGQEMEYDSFDSSGKLTSFTQFTYGAGGGYNAVAYGPTGYETGWADYGSNNMLISSGGGQYNFTLGDEYGSGSDDFDFGWFEQDMGYSANFGFSF